MKIFKKLDKNKNGMLTKAILYGSFIKYLEKDLKTDEMNNIFSKVDADKSGYITFSEFLVASINPRSFLTNDRIMYAFSNFDYEHYGRISVKEIKKSLCPGKII